MSYLSNRALADQVVDGIVGDGGRAVAIQADLSKSAEVARMFDEVEDALGPLDIVFANAADVVIKPLQDCTEEEFVAVFLASDEARWITGQNVGAGGGVF